MTGHLPLRPSNLPALTGLRFLAAGAVFTFHYGASALATAGAPGPVVQLLRNGYLGVSLFFVLSGFILTYTHQHDVLSARYLRGFFVARFARLYPVYFLALMLALPAFPDQPHVLSITSVLLMVQAWTYPASSAGFYWVTQAWTLSVELFFYLCFPLILLASRRLQLATILALASVCAVLMVALGLPSVGPETRYIPFMTPTTLPIPVLRLVEFVYGVMLANLLRFIPLAKIKLGGTLGECVVAGLIVAIMAMTDDMQIKAVSAVLMGVLILQLGAGRGIVSRLLSSKPLILLGGASYALYLIEGPVQALCTRYLSAPFNLIHPALSLAGAVAIFLWWEQPCRKAILAAFRSGHNRTPP